MDTDDFNQTPPPAPHTATGPAHGRKHAHASRARIELKLRDMNQLFNSMDPSPFNDKDLDHDAEEFIVSWAQEYAPGEPVTLRIHLDNWPATDPTALMQEAIHNYFAYRANLNRLELRRLMKQGRTSLIIGVLFLSTCLSASQMLLGTHGTTWTEIARESLSIAGWVAMWRPMQIYLYDWWPVHHLGRVYTKLSRMPVHVVGAAHHTQSWALK